MNGGPRKALVHARKVRRALRRRAPGNDAPLAEQRAWAVAICAARDLVAYLKRQTSKSPKPHR